MKETYENELKIIKNYLALNPNKPKYIVAAETGISIDIIINLIGQKSLVEQAGELKVARSTYENNEERRKKFMQELQKGIETEKIGIQKIKIDEQSQFESQLIVDLNKKKNEIQHIRGINEDNEFIH